MSATTQKQSHSHNYAAWISNGKEIKILGYFYYSGNELGTDRFITPFLGEVEFNAVDDEQSIDNDKQVV